MIKKYKAFGAILLLLYVTYKGKEWIEYQAYLEEDRMIEKSRIEPEDIIEENEQHLWSFDVHCLSKRTNVVFLKTHKTASSTVTSILNKYADINNLDIAIPAGDTRFNWPGPFTHKSVDRSRLKYRRANILCNHSVLNRRELLRIMMPGFRLITILRHPVDQLYSLFHYENFTRLYNMQTIEDPVQLFFQNTSKYYRTFESRVSRDLFQIEHLLKNGQIYDLNFQRFQKRKVKNSFKDFIKYLDKAFHLVLITEYFDEGLVLLKRLLCWDYMDIVYEKKLVNPRIHNHKQNRTEELKKKILNWNNLDWILYKYFKLKFERILAKQNQQKLQEELLIFQELNQHVSTFCVNRTQNNRMELLNYLREIREEPHWLLNQPECFCNKLHRSELHYLKYFREKYPSYYYTQRMKLGQMKTDGC